MMRRRLERTVIVCGAIATVLALYVGVTMVQVWQVGRHDQTRAVDAIVVLGAAQYDGRPSPQLQARLDRALALYDEGWAPLIAVTGGSMPGDRFTEAEASRRYLERQGVPPDAITGEDRGRSTWESMQILSDLLRPAGVTSVLLVSDAFHLMRVRLSASEAGFVAATTPVPSRAPGGAGVGRYVKEAVGIAVGRVVGFERLWRLTG